MLLKSLLYAMGFRNLTDAGDGSAALQGLKFCPADLIVTGWDMQPIGGIELIQTLRAGPGEPSQRADIIMLTAYAERENVIEARNAGMTEFLTKPITTDKLYTRVMSVLKYPRPFIEAKKYVGPCRRRTFPGGYEGEMRRASDETVYE